MRTQTAKAAAGAESRSQHDGGREGAAAAAHNGVRRFTSTAHGHNSGVFWSIGPTQQGTAEPHSGARLFVAGTGQGCHGTGQACISMGQACYSTRPARRRGRRAHCSGGLNKRAGCMARHDMQTAKLSLSDCAINIGIFEMLAAALTCARPVCSAMYFLLRG